MSEYKFAGLGNTTEKWSKFTTENIGILLISVMLTTGL